METRKSAVAIPEALVAEIDQIVGARARDQFVAEAVSFELRRRKQLAALKDAVGCWDPKEHPELRQGALAYQRRIRAESDRSRERAMRRR